MWWCSFQYITSRPYIHNIFADDLLSASRPFVSGPWGPAIWLATGNEPMIRPCMEKKVFGAAPRWHWIPVSASGAFCVAGWWKWRAILENWNANTVAQLQRVGNAYLYVVTHLTMCYFHGFHVTSLFWIGLLGMLPPPQRYSGMWLRATVIWEGFARSPPFSAILIRLGLKNNQALLLWGILEKQKKQLLKCLQLLYKCNAAWIWADIWSKAQTQPFAHRGKQNFPTRF